MIYHRKRRKGEAITFDKVWTIRFADHNRIRREVSGFTDKTASEELERGLNRLVSLRIAGAGPDAELTRQMESWPISLMDRLAAFGLIDRARAAAGRGLEEHIAGWQTAMRAKGNGDRQIIEAANKVGSSPKSVGD
jgi:hypothetical protein